MSEFITPAAHQPHLGNVGVKVGDFTIYPGGMQYEKDGFDPEAEDVVIVPLDERWRPSGHSHEIISQLILPDFGGLPFDWQQRLETCLIPVLAQDKKVVIFCYAGHGRTGTAIASLIALLEPEIYDPINAARTRYCEHAVETEAQARGIFALVRDPLPEYYHGTFLR